MAAPRKDAPRLTEIRKSKVFRDFEVGERFEAGIQLHGTEVKSIRTGKAQISDGFCRVEKDELWMYGNHIETYAFGNIHNHDSKRVRKLFLHRNDIRKITLAMNAGARRSFPCGCISRKRSSRSRSPCAPEKNTSTNGKT